MPVYISSRLQKIALVIVILLAVYTILGFLVFPLILKSVLAEKLTENLGRETVVADIDLNPYALSLTVEGLSIKEPEGSETFVSFERLYLNLQVVSVFERAVIVKEMRLERPYLNLIRHKENRYNFSDLIVENAPQDKTPEDKHELLRFSLNNIQFVDGDIHIWDDVKEKEHKIADINVGLPFISSLPYHLETFVQPHFSAKLNETAFSLDGESVPFHDSRKTVLDIDLKDINIPYYLAYVPLKLDFKMLSGYLDVRGAVSYIDEAEGQTSLSLSGDVALRTVELVDEQGRPILKLPLLRVSIASIEPLAQKIHLSSILIQSPEVNVVRDQEGNVNLQALVPPQEADTGPAESGQEEKTAPLSMAVDDVKIDAAKVTFSDSSPEKPFETILEPINLTVQNFSNEPGRRAALEFSLNTEVNASLKIDGDFSVNPIAAEGTLKLAGVPLRKYAPYYEENIAFVVGDGNLGFQTQFAYGAEEGVPEVSLSDMAVDLASLELRETEEKEAFARIPVLSVKGGDFSLVRKELTVGEIRTEGGGLHCVRYKDGDLNLATLVPPSGEEPDQRDETPEDETPTEGTPWRVTVNNMMVDGYTVKIEDLTPAEPVNLVVEDLKFAAQEISTMAETRATIDVAFQVNQKGGFSTKGMVGINPVSADLNISIENLPLDWPQPYISEQVHIVLADGKFSTKGDLSLSASQQGDMKTTYKGSMVLSDLACVDRIHADDLLKWKALRLDKMDMGINPTFVNIGEISLNDFFASVIVNSDKKLNLQAIVVEKKEPQPVPAESESGPKDEEGKTAGPISVGKVSLKGGRISFTDKSIEPSYSSKLTGIEGSVTGLTSEGSKRADVFLKGRLDDHAPLEIKGEVNPLGEDLFINLKVLFKDIQLSPVSPYSGRYVGYGIGKGKLSLDLEYLIDKQDLEAQNRFFIDQLTFGEKVDSPEATSLPVTLGVALLKNRKGEIDLDIPVSGRLDDPEFKVGKVIWKTIMNLLVKAATSPFALLGALVPGGEQLSVVEFDYGNALITPESQNKLDTLINALYERPALKLDLEGHVDAEQDREGRRQYLFDRKLKAQKLKLLTKKGSPPDSLDDVQIEPDEYETYLRKAYKEETFQKPENFLGFDKKLPVPDMEKLMMEHITVEDGDLRLLAVERAKVVEAYLLASEKIEPQRLFLVEPKSLAPEKKEGLRDSRVDLKLK